ncbi:hypothetical protein FNJ84_07135 [Paracoccus sp. M683]|uniref:hypothetical protein n=1 Tax=Paracoccus sp. M683 TaxID=2594268 RepID=UPI00117EF2EE|nr:hypothetical protein [Paracoccus sp. M683]TRW97290.1 hypothetical protein FNJ84_07135 [Paracoccus sp. M683]
MLIICAGPAWTQTAGWKDAAECAALYHGHYGYETVSFDPADVSEGWLVMADDFTAAAFRLGASEDDIAASTGRAAWWAQAIQAHIFDNDAALAQSYVTQQSICDGLIGELPEMASHR